jgi:hypothetical protein
MFVSNISALTGVQAGDDFPETETTVSRFARLTAALLEQAGGKQPESRHA